MPDFSRRHYAAIAALIEAEYLRASNADEPGCWEDAQYAALDHFATRLADLFERDNPNFNRIRFLQAADAIEWEGD